MPPQRVWFLSRFGLKTGIDFDHYGTTRAYKRICLFNSKRISKEREVSKIYIIRAELLTSALMRSLITLQQSSENGYRGASIRCESFGEKISLSET